MKASIYQWEIVYWIDLSKKWAMVIELEDINIDKAVKWESIINESLYKSCIDQNYIEEVLQDNK